MTNKIYKGDCLEKLKSIELQSIDMIYLDPPFYTEKKHTLGNRERTKDFSFYDTWGSKRGYAEFLHERIELMRPLLKDTGSIFVHCDKSGEHIVRAILDDVFGERNFRSEIIWTYKRWSNSKKGLLPSHQNIYFYSKTEHFKFNTVYRPYSETTNLDQILQLRTRDEHNKSIYEKDSSGNVRIGGKKKGVPLSDVWDIPYLNPKARERVGYPTQKPLLLLEQIINIVTDEGDTVLDPFCGSGTTCVASKILSRQYIGIDTSDDAVELTKERLRNPIRTESNLIKQGRDSYVNADLNALRCLHGIEYNPVQRNKGIDAILVELYEDSPVLVRIQKKDEDIFESASLLAKAMRSRNSKKSFLIKTSIDDEQLSDNFVASGIELLESTAVQMSKHINKRINNKPKTKEKQKLLEF